MNVRLVLVVGIALSLNSLAIAQCEVIETGKCIDFEGLFGYENNLSACTETPCDGGMGGDWDCPGGEAYAYYDNPTDYHYSGPVGSNSVSYSTGSPRVQKRPCDGCQTPTPLTPMPGCLYKAGTVWTDFLWGTNISPAGGPCGV